MSLGRLALIYNVILALGYVPERWRGAKAVLITKVHGKEWLLFTPVFPPNLPDLFPFQRNGMVHYFHHNFIHEYRRLLLKCSTMGKRQGYVFYEDIFEQGRCAFAWYEVCKDPLTFLTGCNESGFDAIFHKKLKTVFIRVFTVYSMIRSYEGFLFKQ